MDLHSLSLNRLLITGPLEDSVPMVVLLEIAHAHGLEYEPEYVQDADFIHEVVQDVSTTPVKVSMGSLARYVNSEVSWTPEALFQAYHWMHAPIILSENLEPGQLTPGHYRVNATMAYGACRKHQIHTRNSTTLEEMMKALMMLAQPLDILQFQVLKLLKVSSPGALVNFLKESKLNSPKPTTVTSEDLIPAFSKMSDPDLLKLCYLPESDAEAVAAAATNINLDISRAQSPLLEYSRVRQALTSPNPQLAYQPYDAQLKGWYRRNPLAFSLSWWQNLDFPNSEKIEPGLYPGPHPECPESYSGESKIDMTDFADLPRGECYLWRDHSILALEAYTLTELYDQFCHANAFLIPRRDPTLLSECQAKRFRQLLLEQRQFVTGPTLQKIDQMLSKMDDIFAFLFAADLPSKQFNQTYSLASPETRASYLDCLIKVLHAGMYMRNWKGPGYPWPLSAEQAMTTAKEYDDYVSIRVTEILNAILDLPQSTRSVVLSLPLVSAVNGGYLISESPKNGLTLKDRFDIVYQGENVPRAQDVNPSACIRESSNYFCASAHKYLLVIGQPAPFDLNSLRQIR